MSLEPVIGRVGQTRNVIAVTPTISAAVAYAVGDAIGGMLTFTDAARLDGGTGMIESVVIIDDDSETAPIDLVFFDRVFTPSADNAPFTPTDADLENCLGYISVVALDYSSFVNNAVATVECALPFQANDGVDNLYAQAVIRAVHTYTAVTDLTIKLGIRGD